MLSPGIAVIDGDNLLHRILHTPALAGLKTAAGFATGGVFGVLTSLRMMLDTFPSVRRCVVVWDGAHSQRRRALLPGYKMRSPKPGDKGYEEHRAHREAFMGQRSALWAVLPQIGVWQVRLQDREADDVIAELVNHHAASIAPALVVSDDKDLLQLVGAHVAVYRPTREVCVTAETFRGALGVSPPLYLMRLVILGDAVDCIPGVYGVGEKTVDRVVSIADKLWIADGRDDGLPEVDDRDGWGALFGSVRVAASALYATDARNRKRYQALLDAGDVLARNVELIDLRREAFSEQALGAIYCFDAGGAFDPAAFAEGALMQSCQALEFGSVIRSWSSWTGPFRRLW